jgi:hypothetical protein
MQQWCNRRKELEVGFEEVWNTLPSTLGALNIMEPFGASGNQVRLTK